MIRDIDTLLQTPVSFLNASGNNSDIAISTRIRLARNLRRYPFPVAATDEEKNEVCRLVTDAVEKTDALGKSDKVFHFSPSDLSDIDREILLERRLASRDFISRTSGTELLVCPREQCSIMVNEEDQLRMQSIRPGFQLNEAWQEINAIDDKLSSVLDFAFDEKLGFLTCCPTNVGTGMRASVMLHLPALVLTEQITPTIHGINKLHLAVRGTFGEGSDNCGNLFQVSNQSTLGEKEQSTLAELTPVIEQLILHERQARKYLLEHEQYKILDFIGRSYGVLRHCYKLSCEEALQSLSGVRLGVDLGLFKSLTLRQVNELFISVLPAHIRKAAGVSMSDKCDFQRASFSREMLRLNT